MFYKIFLFAMGAILVALAGLLLFQPSTLIVNPEIAETIGHIITGPIIVVWCLMLVPYRLYVRLGQSMRAGQVGAWITALVGSAVLLSILALCWTYPTPGWVSALVFLMVFISPERFSRRIQRGWKRVHS